MHPDSLRQLIANCRRKGGRRIGYPCDWQPGRVRQPDMPGYYFTERGAWELIAEKLETGHPYEEIRLDMPLGEPAIVMKIDFMNGDPVVYVKVQIGVASTAIGRSFHYSDRF